MFLRFRDRIMVGALFWFASSNVQATDTELRGGRSPDGRLAIELKSESTKAGGAILSYVVTDLKTGEALLRIKSSYSTESTEPDEVPDRWLDLAKSTDVYWNKDSSFVAIDEYPLQHSGHVFLVAIGRKHRARRLTFPESEIIRRTGFEWARVRIRVCEHEENSRWIDNHHLCVSIGGFPSRKTGDTAPASSLTNQTLRAVIEIGPDLRARVNSIARGLDSHNLGARLP